MPVALDGLNRAQEAAVTHADGPLVVVAGAGTGKTHTIVAPVRLARGPGPARRADPRAHLLGARRRRTCASGSRSRSTRPTRSSTSRRSARSACASSRTRRSRRAWTRSSRRSRPADRLALLLERLDDLSLRAHEIRGNPAPLLASFVSRIDRLKNEMVSAADYRAYAERIVAEAARATPPAPTPRASSSSRACTPTTTGCSPSAARSTSATSCCAPSSSSTSARTCASAWRAASSTCSWTSTRRRTSPRACCSGS